MNSLKKIKKPLNWSVKSINDRIEIWDYIAVKEHSPMNAVSASVACAKPVKEFAHRFSL